ncbi:MAG: class I SAM-dependent methyltransferase [Spirochaetaceae bacterium]|nr:class I SAM-dependent methyltransferase [Myxococcales bacterium]MCB9725129.1 class I SAM-dependent methyltransferase [Spirochaetaceae bacterium]HPG24129.1 class I SAM-dependent methyltransferase [Myxococcota bacterium]
MIEGQPSDTARQTAAARAAHLAFDPPPHLLEDRAAEALLGEDARALMEPYRDGGPWILAENRLFITLRARYAEDRLRAAHAQGVRQYVLLGAGLDSFAFRRPAALSDVTIYEVDHPSTQDWKRARLEELGWPIPENVHFVPCDFERRRASEVLRAAGFDPEGRAVVCWMGVVYYLRKETVATSLADLASLLADGSEVVLDYMRPWEELSARYLEIRDQMTAWLERAGEPQVTRYPREELLETIRKAGFAHAHTEDRDEIVRRYLRPLEIRIPLSERFGLAVATR